MDESPNRPESDQPPEPSGPPQDPEPAAALPEADDGGETPPLGQRFFDSPFILLALGMVIMAVFFTLWGLYEITSLPQATLP